MNEKNVFVTVGTHPQPFNRLLKKIDELAEKKVLRNVFAQTGYSDYIPRNYAFKPFLDVKEFRKKMENADLVISHGGEGNLGLAVQLRKPCIAMPRLQKFGEHSNDHQIELVEVLAKQKLIIAVLDEKNLEDAFGSLNKIHWQSLSNASGIIRLLDTFVKKQ